MKIKTHRHLCLAVFTALLFLLPSATVTASNAFMVVTPPEDSCDLPAPEGLRILIASVPTLVVAWEGGRSETGHFAQLFRMTRGGEVEDEPIKTYIIQENEVRFEQVRAGYYQVRVAEICPENFRFATLRGGGDSPKTGRASVLNVVQDEIPFVVRPSSGGRGALLSLQLSKDDAVSIDVFDNTGRVVNRVKNNEVLKAGSYEIPVYTEGVSLGLYFIQVRTSMGQRTQKFVQFNP